MQLQEARKALISEGLPIPIVDRFLKVFVENIHIWQMFERKALQRARLKMRFGAKEIMEDLRYKTPASMNGEFKIGNSYTAYFGRMFVLKYPHYSKYLKTRKVRGFKNA